MSEPLNTLGRAWERFEGNTLRVRALAALARPHTHSSGSVRTTHYGDILRAGVVFLHATLEDWLRAIGSVFLPHCDADVLDDIPLSGLGERPSKFFLGELRRFKEMPARDVIQKSVDEYLNRVTFNNVGDVKKLLKQAGFDASIIQPYVDGMGEAMKRRHLIVHRADQSTPPHSAGDLPQDIKEADVNRWINAVSGFASSLHDAARARLLA